MSDRGVGDGVDRLFLTHPLIITAVVVALVGEPRDEPARELVTAHR